MHIARALDDIGRPAWIVLMVAGFIVFWPIGLAILGFMIWSGRMSCGKHGRWAHWQESRTRHMAGGGFCRGFSQPSSGNSAFDDYRAETLQRLEDEQREFTEFLDRLRRAKDKAEFDQFMADRRQRPPVPDNPPSGNPAP
jgi:hypothetical protein